MKDTTQRTIRASLISQKNAKNRILEGYANRAQANRDQIAAMRAKIAALEDTNRNMREDTKQIQEDIALIVDAYHDLWNEDVPDNEDLP